ncbi:hypothetical protein ASG93_03815 [Paenibacillus sp. Soil787]|nr:hypothetical protein ASG93_03815 [Paenibacillus sp. Soil787]
MGGSGNWPILNAATTCASRLTVVGAKANNMVSTEASLQSKPTAGTTPATLPFAPRTKGAH